MSDYEVAEKLNRYFDNAVRKLNINEPIEYMIHGGNIKDPIQEVISKYANHPSIVNINKIIKHSSFFVRIYIYIYIYIYIIYIYIYINIWLVTLIFIQPLFFMVTHEIFVNPGSSVDPMGTLSI